MRFGSSFNGYEKIFISRMLKLQKEGFDFEAGARLALEAKFGGAAEVLLRDLSEQAKSDPTLFVQELSRTFGRGSAGFLEPAMKWADRGLFPHLSPDQMAHETIVSQLLPGESREDRVAPLHEHRVRDDQGKYSDEYD